ncbi:MAG: GNAT family N-acetyltransferase [Niabella sp.]
MDILHKTDGKKGEFIIRDNAIQAGLMTYTLAGNIMIIDHTEVDEAFEGKGLGKQLVQAGVDYARENKLRIKPLCPFAKRILDRQYETVKDILF